MTMAAAIDRRTTHTTVWSTPGRIALIDFFADLGEAEAVWRSLETQQYLFTPYQRFDFLRHWQRQVGTREGLHPLIVVAYDQTRVPLLLLPLVLGGERGLRVARFMGGKHATFNMGVWNREYIKHASRNDLDWLLSRIREHSGADVMALHQQPLLWQDLPNPLALLDRQPSANDCPLMTIAPGSAAASLVSHSLRQRLKAKERKLKGLPGY